MDAFGHVNHANTVTLLEEARFEMLFADAAQHGESALGQGIVVARLTVAYHTPLIVNGVAVRVEVGVKDVRAASFTLDYTVHSGVDGAGELVATAETLMVPYDLVASRPRRLSTAEIGFLERYRPEAKDA
jgi:acyl-CoA thioester hydrolase